jgi:hypothetical protein
MQLVNRKWRLLATVLLTGVLLRAFIPAGYMPAAPGQGLLLELCPSGLPTGFISASANNHGSHGHHTGHGAQNEHEMDGDCSLGHILSFAFIDAAVAPDVELAPVASIIAVAALELVLPARVHAYAARGPPLP